MIKTAVVVKAYRRSGRMWVVFEHEDGSTTKQAYKVEAR